MNQVNTSLNEGGELRKTKGCAIYTIEIHNVKDQSALNQIADTVFDEKSFPCLNADFSANTKWAIYPCHPPLLQTLHVAIIRLSPVLLLLLKVQEPGVFLFSFLFGN